MDVSKLLLKREKLTKKFLMQLPEGTFLSSNVPDNQGCPIFTEFVVPMSSREDQWKRVVKAKANGRTANVFRDKTDYARWHDSIKNAPNSEWRVESWE